MSNNQAQQGLPPPKSIVISELPEANRVELSIFGAIEEPIEYTFELVTLNDLTRRYPICHVHINSPGGSLMTCLQLVSILRKFPHVVTIATGEAASAGFILWSLGHIRVADDYTLFMAHRESFGSYGKTDQHLRMSQVSDKLYTELYKDTVDQFLTDDEVRDSKITEVWLTSNDLIERGHAISMETFNNPPYKITNSKLYTIEDEDNERIYFVYDENLDGFIMLESYRLSDLFVSDLTTFAAGMEDPIQLVFEEDDSLADEVEDSMAEFMADVEEQMSNTVIPENKNEETNP